MSDQSSPHSASSAPRTDPKPYYRSFMDPERAARGDAYVHTLRNVLLETEYCAIFDGDKVYYPETSGRNFKNHAYVVEPGANGRPSLVALPQPSLTISHPFILLGTDGASNYSHWLSRNLLKFAVLEKANVPESLPILLNEDLSAYQREHLELLGIPAARLMLVPSKTVIRCSEVTVPTILRGQREYAMGIDWLRRRFAHVMAPVEKVDRLVFVSRRDSIWRMLLNEAEVEAALAKLGFETVVLAGMSAADQIRTFSSARVIVGAHGAGLTNLIFASPRTQVIEISNVHMHHMGDFRDISECLGLSYTEIVSGSFPPDQPPLAQRGPMYWDYFVDTAQVVAAAEAALERTIRRRGTGAFGMARRLLQAFKPGARRGSSH